MGIVPSYSGHTAAIGLRTALGIDEILRMPVAIVPAETTGHSVRKPPGTSDSFREVF